MAIFNIRIKGTNRFVPIDANCKHDAIMKFMLLMRSRTMFMVKDPQLKPGTITKSRRIFRGK